MDMYSYVVRYDSGFAPNPFYGYCTLATCKPLIRKSAKVGDWLVGSGSADKKINQGGKLVYAMKVCEVLTFNEYFHDQRFERKRPILSGSRKQARGDNIYYMNGEDWRQLDSYHSNEDGSMNNNHVDRDTSVDRVLIAKEFVYFGGGGPSIPNTMKSGTRYLCHKGRGRSKFSSDNTHDELMINRFIVWLKSLGETGYVSHPLDWNDSQ